LTGQVKFACVDGPEFDGWKVDFDQAMQRSRMYKTEEGRLFLEAKEEKSHGGCGVC
jgi:ferredoxin--NADP+ reductase